MIEDGYFKPKEEQMRCPDCEKFVSMENGEPEVETIDVDACDGGATVSASIRLIRECAECGTELKAVDVEADSDVVEFDERCESEAAVESKHDLAVDVDEANVEESGGSRYKKNMISVDVEFGITCLNKGCRLSVKGSLRGEMAASGFEESA